MSNTVYVGNVPFDADGAGVARRAMSVIIASFDVL
jgi:hypothetical protein